MKRLKCASILFAFVVLLLAGCSDEAQSPVTPTDQAIQAPAPLQKNFIRYFVGKEGPDPVDPALIVYPPRIVDNGKMFGSLQEHTYFHATFSDGAPDLLSGKGVLELNYKYDPNANEGFTWGKLTVKPYALEGSEGVWEITWHGKMWVDMTTGQTISPLEWVGHGKGGVINGMQLHCDDTIYMTNYLNWEGKGGKNDYVKEH